MDTFVCSVCGHIYDPEKGEPDQGINPGIAFADLPASWQCPICGAAPDKFSKA